MAKFNAGDIVAYSTNFLTNIGLKTTDKEAKRRGVFVKQYEGNDRFSRIKWSDFDFDAAAEQNGEDYAIDVRDNGQLVLTSKLRKVKK